MDHVARLARTALRTALMAIVLAGAVAGGERVAGAADVHGAPLPKRARAGQDGRFASPLSFRDTVAWYRKELARRGSNVDLIGPVRHRDVVFVRILPRDRGTSWAAVHIVLADGRTTIYILAASGPEPSNPKAEN